MPLTPGTRLGVYEIIAAIGEGGMGQVFRARDTKLDRDVAIKILPEAFAHDADRLARFTCEAKTLASLNHPHIAAIYGLETGQEGREGQEGRVGPFLVMELVEGEDLSQRIATGAIPIDEALPIAKQIAEALEAAHEQGIIHRDLKPANIKVRSDGTVKVLDFGLAKAMEPKGAMSTSMSMSPTITTPAMTQAGMILGTAAYMSPEQAKGRTVDKRADIWAYGCVLFEMLTGRSPFRGDTVSETLADVMRSEPPWPLLSASVPASLHALMRRCLVKEPRQRMRDIGDVRLALEGAFETAAPQTTATTAAASVGRLAWMAFAGVAVIVAAALAVPAVRHLRETPPPETRVDLVTPATDSPVSFALSPDGRQIVFAATEAGGARLWLRSLATTTAQPLVGTEGATFPFWAPDGRAIGFFAGNALKRLDLGGGAPQTLAPVTGGYGGTWNADGVILFAPSASSPLLRVAATGGLAVAVTTLAPSQQAHYGPAFLPDGRRFLFSVGGRDNTAGIYLGALDGGPPTRLTPAASPGWYLPKGWLVWLRAGTATLVAQRLDVETAALTGAPVTLADGVAFDTVLIRAAVSVAATGLVAYRTGGGGLHQLTWVDRAGTARGTLGEPDATLTNPRVAPDGRRVAVARTVQGNQDLWLLDGARTTRFTFDPAADRFPVWSPDGARLVFYSARTGVGDLYAKLTSGAGVEERLVASDQTKGPSSWSADGRFLLYTNISPKTSSDVWVLPMAGDPKPLPFLNSTFTENLAGFSLDGHWVAYQSDESGHYEIYVRPFPGPGGQWQVSTGGGIHPVWRPDGKELYYLNQEGAMMAAPISVTGTAVAPGAPVMLFPTRILGGGVDTQNGRQYDVAPDGRFLINTELPGDVAPITLIQNWQPEAKK